MRCLATGLLFAMTPWIVFPDGGMICLCSIGIVRPEKPTCCARCHDCPGDSVPGHEHHQSGPSVGNGRACKGCLDIAASRERPTRPPAGAGVPPHLASIPVVSAPSAVEALLESGGSALARPVVSFHDPPPLNRPLLI